MTKSQERMDFDYLLRHKAHNQTGIDRHQQSAKMHRTNELQSIKTMPKHVPIVFAPPPVALHLASGHYAPPTPTTPRPGAFDANRYPSLIGKTRTYRYP